MDTGEGRFEMISGNGILQKRKLEERFPKHGGWFRVGEIIEVRGSRFRVKAVKPNQLILKLLPKEQ